MKICSPLLSTALLLGMIAPALAQPASVPMASPTQPIREQADPEQADREQADREQADPEALPTGTAADLVDSQADPQTDLQTGPQTNSQSLRIVPRLGLNHTSSGGGYDGTTRLEGFLPLRQTAGENITFLEGDFLIDNDANLGGNLVLGHRFYDANRDRIWGGYLAADQRQTDHNSFYQLGLGLESLGRIDVRVNGYLPLGDRSDLLNESSFDSGTRTTTGFSGNLLVLANERTRRTSQLWETALGGFDAEIGGRILRWDDGDLRAYGGLYYYGGPNSDDSWGWRLRLEAHPIDQIMLGAMLQNDELFGTNLAVSVGLSWPRVRPQSEVETVATRLGEPVLRSPTIVVNQQENVEEQIERTERPLMNPEEERPYQFQHVVLGRRGGDGTFENPFGTVQEALDATRSDGNAVVYVDRGNNAQIPAFTIPNRVRVLSQGPTQILAGMPFPGFPRRTVRLPFSPTNNFRNGILVRLPESNDGRFPLIQDEAATDLVTLSNRSILSGFRIANAAENAIVGRNIIDTEIRDNQISNSGRGIFLDQIADSVVLFDNVIRGSNGSNAGEGILIQDGQGSAEVTIARQRLVNNRVGLSLEASGDLVQRRGASQTVQINDVTIENNAEQGIRLAAEQFGNQIVQLENSTVQNNGGTGVQIQASRSGSQEVTLRNSQISTNSGNGIEAVAGERDGATIAAQEVFIRDNRIENNRGDGIRIIGNEQTAQEFAIDRNQIRNNGGAGIRATVNNSAFQEYVTDADNGSEGISNNLITGNGDQGIELTANSTATLVADIKANQLADNQTSSSQPSSNRQPDLEVSSTSAGADVCVVVQGNSSPDGIRLDNNSLQGISGLFEVGDLSTVSTRNLGPVEFRPNQTAFSNKPGAASCFQ
jgi:trimeric autotransporter adhesin